MRLPSEEEFNEWKTLYVTQYVGHLLNKKRETLRQDWEGGSFTDYTQEGTVLVNVGNMGTCKGYAFVADLAYDDLLTEIDDGKQVGIGPAGGSSVD
tara:strand:- start:20776 stop:21063 length:288 start_codon:yes stop_codon:yes gene_type:complete